MISSNNGEYAIITDNEVSAMLSYFSHDFIYSVVTKSIKEKIRSYNMAMPNIVVSYEEHFKQMIETYPDSTNTILTTRNDVYTEIIKLLCDSYQVIYDDNDLQDRYSSAVYLYDFLVSNFQNNIVEFFTNYILKEKNNIYEVLNFASFRRNKDSSTIYSKKVYKNTRLGVICANLDSVIDNISVFDIDFHTYITTVYGYNDRNIAKHIETVLRPINDFFKDHIVSCFQTGMRPVLVTSIRLKLQELTAENDLNINTITREEQDDEEK